MKRPFVIGLTGSIGMGKSTAAAMFAEEGAAIWDADSAVHRLYASGGAAVPEVARLCPEAVSEDTVDRTVLSAWVRADADNLKRLEEIVHPLVAEDRARFLDATDADVVVLDIPLLLESGRTGTDLVVVVSAPPAIQRERVLARPGMTEEKFEMIRARQMPDAEKRKRADVVIDSSTLEGARASVRSLMDKIRAGNLR